MDLFRELARTSLAGRPLDDVPTEIARVATGGIPGAESTSITVVKNDRAFTAAHHGTMALGADGLQYGKGHGPCMDAGRGGESRWDRQERQRADEQDGCTCRDSSWSHRCARSE